MRKTFTIFLLLLLFFSISTTRISKLWRSPRAVAIVHRWVNGGFQRCHGVQPLDSRLLKSSLINFPWNSPQERTASIVFRRVVYARSPLHSPRPVIIHRAQFCSSFMDPLSIPVASSSVTRLQDIVLNVYKISNLIINQQPFLSANKYRIDNRWFLREEKFLQ